MKAFRTLILLILTLVIPHLGQAVELRQLCRLTVEVEGGSLLIGTPRTDHLPFVTAYGRLDIPVNRIESLVASGDHETFTLHLAGGEVVRGAPEQRSLEVETLMGTLEVPLQHVRSASFTAPEVFGGHAYLPLDEAMTWREAYEHARGIGGQLVVIDGALENQFVTEMMGARGHDHCWIGYTDERKEGVFRWVDGSSTSFTSWSANEPNNAANGEHHAHLYTSGALTGTWNDWTPDIRLPFVVELELG
jgi:hypothetical protein